MQLVEDVEEEKELTGQEEQTKADAAEYFPATQIPLTTDSPEVVQYDPAGHAVQLVDPVLAA